jgi:hypothetical protein
VAIVTASLVVAAPTATAGAAPVVGNDISWPQCGRAYPAPGGFGIVGVNGGRPFTTNPCLVSEYRWARASGVVALYMNTANPGVAAGDAYGYGLDAAQHAYSYATSHVSAGPGHVWWLDVETGNSWSADQAANTAVIAGSIAFFSARGVHVGIYSTAYQWGRITGGARFPAVPNWVPGARSAAEAPSFCAARRSFSGGPVVMAQYTTDFDYDYLCPAPKAAPDLLGAIVAWLASL